jgi:hypothetical protein
MNLSFSNSWSYNGRNNYFSMVEKKEKIAFQLFSEFKSLSELEKDFPDEQSCVDYLEKKI